MVDIRAYLLVNLLNSSARSTIGSSFSRILISNDWNTSFCLVALVSELIELCKVEVHVCTCCKTLSVVETGLIVSWVLTYIVTCHYAVGSIDNLIVVIPYYLTLIGGIWTVSILE